MLYLAEEFPDIGVVAPRPDEATVSLSLQVPDVAETMRRASTAARRMPRPMYDDYGSRNATIVDPFGHRWLLQTPLARAAGHPAAGRRRLRLADRPGPGPGRRLLRRGAGLGVRARAPSPAGGQSTAARCRSASARGEPGWHLSYAVDDVAAAVERVRAAGGTATDPEDRPYGPAADCADDQGAPFALHPAGGPARARRRTAPARATCRT